MIRSMSLFGTKTVMACLAGDVCSSSVKNSEVLDLESRNGTPRQSNLPGIGFAEGD
jgi:hypothetical protein